MRNISATLAAALLTTALVTLGCTAQGPTAATTSLVIPARFALSGVVREAAPGQRPIQNARLQITAGLDFGTVAMTDASGAFTFPSLASGRVLAEVSRDGYALSEVDLTLSSDRYQEVWLAPGVR